MKRHFTEKISAVIKTFSVLLGFGSRFVDCFVSGCWLVCGFGVCFYISLSVLKKEKICEVLTAKIFFHCII